MPAVETRIDFFGENIRGIILPHALPNFDLQCWRTQFAATQGVSEIVGSLGGRPLEIPIVLRSTDFTDREAIEEYIEVTLNGELGGANDTVRLYLADGSILDYPDCTCHGFAKTSDPKPDEAGTLRTAASSSDTNTYWFCTGVMRFYQLGGG